ncbi:MAG: D-alanyl-D-alanine carboxypeptidase/D-alanyl-D-alanine endopeptidase [Acidimicrobiia bacterium]
MRHPSRSRVVLLVSSLAVGAMAVGGGVALPQGADPALARLGSELDGILSDPKLAGATVAALVRDADTGETFYSRDPARRLLPASNAKLLVSAAALEVLGPDHHFETAVLSVDAPHAGLVEGDLYLRGGGDPTLLPDDYDRLAGDLSAAGVQVIGGDLVADDTWFDDVRLGPDWAWDDEDQAYAAQVSALTVAPDGDFDAGTVAVDVSPGDAPGSPVQARLVPETDHVQLVNQAVTGGDSANAPLSFDRQHGSNVLVLSGSVAGDAAPRRLWASVWDPTGHASAVFRGALARHGITLRGLARRGPTPPTAAVLARHLSAPLAELLIPMLKLSNNGHAEVLVKEIGQRALRRGTWDDGLAETARALGRLGLDPEALRVADGSGLSRRDLASPEQLSALLVTLRGKPWFPAFLTALPLAGNPDRLVGGTLRSRMREGPAAANVRAKTGTLDAVSALSGYVTTADGELLVFSILLNHYLGPAPKGIEDAFATALAGFSRQPGEPSSGPQARSEAGHKRPGQSNTGLDQDHERRGASPETDRRDGDTLGLECSWTKSC